MATANAPSAADVLEAKVLTGERNPRGIPQVEFIEDIDGFIAARGLPADEIIYGLQVLHKKYQLMEASFLEQRARLKQQIPDITASLEATRTLRRKQEEGATMHTHFNLSDQVYVGASVAPNNKVCLWLGADVMVEYSYEEAEGLLTANLAAAETKLQQKSEDLEYLRDQIITTEVNMARLYNAEVRKKKSGGGAGGAAA